jgi:CDGSH-type Zn-finger protein
MTQENQQITVRPNGPYLVRGGIPLVRKSQVMSEYGEPLAWQDDGSVDSQDVYRLCRCGQSNSKPFCDGSHTMLGFETVSRQKGSSCSVKDGGYALGLEGRFGRRTWGAPPTAVSRLQANAMCTISWMAI